MVEGGPVDAHPDLHPVHVQAVTTHVRQRYPSPGVGGHFEPHPGRGVRRGGGLYREADGTRECHADGDEEDGADEWRDRTVRRETWHAPGSTRDRG